MFITIQNHIVQSEALQHVELIAPLIHLHIAGRSLVQITYPTKADAESAFKRIAGTLKSENTGLKAALES